MGRCIVSGTNARVRCLNFSCLFSQNLDNTTTTFRDVVYFQFHSASGINWTIHPDLFGFSLKKYRWNLFTVGVTVSLYTVYVIKLQWVDFSICTWSQLQSKISAWDGTADMPVANLPTVTKNSPTVKVRRVKLLSRYVNLSCSFRQRKRSCALSNLYKAEKRKFPGTFVPRTFRSQELSFLRLFYKALAMNADSYSNCQNLFHRRPSSVIAV